MYDARQPNLLGAPGVPFALGAAPCCDGISALAGQGCEPSNLYSALSSAAVGFF